VLKRRFFYFIPYILGIFFSVNSCVALSNSRLLYWNSEAFERLSRSESKVDFYPLSNHFQSQMDSFLCGPTTGAIVLNALRMGKKGKILPEIALNKKYRRYLKNPKASSIFRYTPENFMDQRIQKVKTLEELYGKAINKDQDFGLQLQQIHEIFLSHGLKSKIRVVTENLSDETVKSELISNLKTKDDYVVINYKRSVLGQKGFGHISPLGAYDKKTDSFLIMDVNSSKYSWVWVSSKKLIKAMRTFDKVTNRGYLLLSDS